LGTMAVYLGFEVAPQKKIMLVLLPLTDEETV
jgi:hypothetical protein